MKNLQKWVDRWVRHNKGYFKPHEILVRLMEEMGELAREINHMFRPQKEKRYGKDG